jgi:hypothetical protein
VVSFSLKILFVRFLLITGEITPSLEMSFLTLQHTIIDKNQ